MSSKNKFISWPTTFKGWKAGSEAPAVAASATRVTLLVRPQTQNQGESTLSHNDQNFDWQPLGYKKNRSATRPTSSLISRIETFRTLSPYSIKSLKEEQIWFLNQFDEIPQRSSIACFLSLSAKSRFKPPTIWDQLFRTTVSGIFMAGYSGNSKDSASHGKVSLYFQALS